MVVILTDRPLEEIMEHAPPRGKGYVEEELLLHGCIRLIRRDNLRVNYLKNFNCSFDQQVNNLLRTDVDHWYTYISADTIFPCIDVRTFLFVYWYLTKGKHIVLYDMQNMPGFGPETMVSTIDIAPKGPGMTPMEDYHLIPSDVLYHFLDPSGSAHTHDTAILERMVKDECFNGHPEFSAAVTSGHDDTAANAAYKKTALPPEIQFEGINHVVSGNIDIYTMIETMNASDLYGNYRPYGCSDTVTVAVVFVLDSYNKIIDISIKVISEGTSILFFKDILSEDGIFEENTWVYSQLIPQIQTREVDPGVVQNAWHDIQYLGDNIGKAFSDTVKILVEKILAKAVVKRITTAAVSAIIPDIGWVLEIINVGLATHDPYRVPKELSVLVEMLKVDIAGYIVHGDIERIDVDKKYYKGNFSMGRIPKDNITLKELMEISGNCQTYTIIYDYDEAMSVLNELGDIYSPRENEVWKKYAKPLEIITSYEQYWEWKSNGWQITPMAKKDSKYNDCPVKMYCLYSRSSVDLLSKICIQDTLYDNNRIGMIVLV